MRRASPSRTPALAPTSARSPHPAEPSSFLDLSFNELSALPPGLACCTALRALSLAFNPLGPALPPVVCKLVGLAELNLDYTGAATWAYKHTTTQLLHAFCWQ